MKSTVNQWVQEGVICIWRYANPGRSSRGWHFTADPLGCRSIRNLLDCMHAGGPCRRTLRLGPVTDAVLSVPNFGGKIAERFENLRIEYRPEVEDLDLSPTVEALIMTIGDRRLRKLSAAFAQVEIGRGDFGISTSDDRKAAHWMFWWMPSTNYQRGTRP